MGIRESYEKFKIGLNKSWHGFTGSVVEFTGDVTEALGLEQTTEVLRERYIYHKAQEDFWKSKYNSLEEEDHPKPIVIQPTKPIEVEDAVLVEKIKNRVENNYDKLKDMQNQGLNQRFQTMQGIIEDLTGDYGVDVTGITLYLPDPDKPTFKEDYGIDGEHIRNKEDVKKHYIRINATNLIYDDVDGYESVLLAAVHELMHARQWEASTRQKDFDYSNERLLEWYHNWLPGNYTPYYVDDKVYRKDNAVERDAFALERVIKEFIETLKNK